VKNANILEEVFRSLKPDGQWRNQGGGGPPAPPPPIGPKKKNKREKNALLAHLRGLFAAIGVSIMSYKAILQALEGGG